MKAINIEKLLPLLKGVFLLDVYSRVIMMILIMAFAAAFDVVGIFLLCISRKGEENPFVPQSS